MTRKLPQSIADAVEAAGGRVPKRNKYHVRIDAQGKADRTVDGIRFDSKAEAEFYETLKSWMTWGALSYFLRQVPFDLGGGTKYRCDFMLVWRDGTIEYIDVKGVETPLFRRSKKQVEAAYPVEIKLRKIKGGAR